MPEQRQHKRFTISLSNDLSLPICQWYAQTGRCGMPSDNKNNSKNIRPWCLHD